MAIRELYGPWGSLPSTPLLWTQLIHHADAHGLLLLLRKAALQKVGPCTWKPCSTCWAAMHWHGTAWTLPLCHVEPSACSPIHVTARRRELGLSLGSRRTLTRSRRGSRPACAWPCAGGPCSAQSTSVVEQIDCMPSCAQVCSCNAFAQRPCKCSTLALPKALSVGLNQELHEQSYLILQPAPPASQTRALTVCGLVPVQASSDDKLNPFGHVAVHCMVVWGNLLHKVSQFQAALGKVLAGLSLKPGWSEHAGLLLGLHCIVWLADRSCHLALEQASLHKA